MAPAPSRGLVCAVSVVYVVYAGMFIAGGLDNNHDTTWPLIRWPMRVHLVLLVGHFVAWVGGYMDGPYAAYPGRVSQVAAAVVDGFYGSYAPRRGGFAPFDDVRANRWTAAAVGLVGVALCLYKARRLMSMTRNKETSMEMSSLLERI